MSPTPAWSQVAGVLMIVALAGSHGSTPPVPIGASSAMLSCTSPEYREFDFWVGDWDVFESNSANASAHVRVDRILGGCALRERYEDGSGLQGESLSVYDAGRNLWHQTWVTNRGQLLTIEGELEHGDMVLTGPSYSMGAQPTQVRGTWKPVTDGVREVATTSVDAGKSWKPWFDLRFRQSSRSQREDEEAVAALDEQFQAAVKANDFATMDKILACDFILVTGSGKVFNKSDLLQEARSRSSIFEHQEDTQRTVRVWSDTAMVTAKLWIKGLRDGRPIDYVLWFSDTYVRTPEGWRYVFGQASLPLPGEGKVEAASGLLGFRLQTGATSRSKPETTAQTCGW